MGFQSLYKLVHSLEPDERSVDRRLRGHNRDHGHLARRQYGIENQQEESGPGPRPAEKRGRPQIVTSEDRYKARPGPAIATNYT